MEPLVAILLGIISAIVAVVLLQIWPHGYRWSKDISWTEGSPSGDPIHQVKLGRRRRKLLKKYRPGPIDLSFYARIAVEGIGYRPDAEKVVAIPVSKSWRPAVGRSTLIKLLPAECDPRDLRYFPPEILEKRRRGTLTTADLLSVGDAKLRVYVFANRPRTGTRWMLKAQYDRHAVKPGVFDGMKVSVPEDGCPPKRPDLLRRDQAHFRASLGRWRLGVWRDEPGTERRRA
jgi:hypothetical protein